VLLEQKLKVTDSSVHLQLMLVGKGNNIKIFAFLDGLISHFHCL